MLEWQRQQREEAREARGDTRLLPLPFDDRLRALESEYGADACWVWPGATNTKGYAYSSELRDGVHRRFQVHREAYRRLVGPVDDELTLDHLCRNRRCCNPAHLEPVSRGENALRGTGPTAKNNRKTHCKWGHPLTPDNLYSLRGGKWRVCRACALLRRAQCHPLTLQQDEHEARIAFARDHQLVHPDHREYAQYLPGSVGNG